MKSTWTVVVFGSAGETQRTFFYEAEARLYAARARNAGCLARILTADQVKGETP